jgi:hypothetical protein
VVCYMINFKEDSELLGCDTMSLHLVVFDVSKVFSAVIFRVKQSQDSEMNQ